MLSIFSLKILNLKGKILTTFLTFGSLFSLKDNMNWSCELKIFLYSKCQVSHNIHCLIMFITDIRLGLTISIDISFINVKECSLIIEPNITPNSEVIHCTCLQHKYIFNL